MSRSNPTEHLANPAVRWFEWNGEHGVVRYYDKDAKKNVEVPLPFTFLLLDELASVRGWHDASDSGIYSNEVKDTRTDVLIVKAFKGGTLIEGLYADIKDRAKSLGGNFTANCYIAFRNGGEGLSIGALRFKGSALGAWMEFRKACRQTLYDKAVAIDGFVEGKKGRIVFRTPTFKPQDVAAGTNEAATALDRELQAFFKAYFSRKTHDRAESPADDDGPDDDSESAEDVPQLTDDDIPFMWLMPFVLPFLAAGMLWS